MITTNHRRWTSTRRRMYVYTAPQHSTSKSNIGQFDTDSFSIVVDTGCSRSLSPRKADFITSTLRKVSGPSATIHGLAGATATISCIGTILWKVIDDDGVEQEIQIPNSLFVPTAGARLLSPHQVSQVTRDKLRWVVMSNKMILSWHDVKDGSVVSKKTLCIDKGKSNIASLWAAHGFKRYAAFEARYKAETLLLPELELYEDKGSIMELADKLKNDKYELDIDPEFWKTQIKTPLPDPVNDTYIDIRRPVDAKLLWHQRLGHISMSRIDRLSKLGFLPSILARTPHPICQACIYGKMTRRPWRCKPTLESANKIITVKVPGATISVDQLESPILGCYWFY